MIDKKNISAAEEIHSDKGYELLFFDTIFRKNIKAAEEIHSDKGYELGTEEGQKAFAKKRQEAALDEMVRLSQEMGLYDDEFENK